MDLVSILVALIILGVVLYLIQIIPMDARVKQIILVIAIAFIAIWAIRMLLGGGPVLNIR